MSKKDDEKRIRVTVIHRKMGMILGDHHQGGDERTLMRLQKQMGKLAKVDPDAALPPDVQSFLGTPEPAPSPPAEPVAED